MQKKRVLHVISSLKLGGAETILVQLANALKVSFDQHIVYFHEGPLVEQLKALDIPLVHIKPTYGPLFLYRLGRIIKKMRPDIIHCSLWAAQFFSIPIARFFNIPIICSIHTVREHEGQLRNILDRFTLPYASKIIAVSAQVAHSIQKALRLPEKKLILIRNGIDSKEMLEKAAHSPITRNSLSLTPTDFVVGAVGRFVPVKKFDVLLSVLAPLMHQYATIRALFIGIGPELQALQNQAKAFNIEQKVQFIIGQQAYNYYKLFDCFVQPSAFEGLSLALLEALALKVPCIVTATSKNHEIVSDQQHGLVIDAHDSQELSQAIEFIYRNSMENKAVIESLVSEGSKLVLKNYDSNVMTEAYKRVFTEQIK